MSQTYHEVVARTNDGVLPRKLRKLGPRALGEAPAGWRHWRLPREPYLYLDGFEKLLTAMTGGPVLGLYVETSDFGYICGLADGKVVARAVINPESAIEFKNGVWAMDKLREESSTGDWQDVSIGNLREWSSEAPRRLSEDEARGLLDQNWLFPEEGLEELRGLLGLSAPDRPV